MSSPEISLLDLLYPKTDSAVIRSVLIDRKNTAEGKLQHDREMQERKKQAEGLEKQALLLSQTPYDYEADELVSACEQGALARVKTLVTLNKKHINFQQPGLMESTPLCRAAEKGFLKIVDFLLEQGADPNIKTALYEESPLFLICSQDTEAVDSKVQCEIIEKLLQSGANVNDIDSLQRTAIMILLENSVFCVKSLELLLQAGADLLHTISDTPMRPCTKTPFSIFCKKHLDNHEALHLMLFYIKERIQKEHISADTLDEYKAGLFNFILKFVGNPAFPGVQKRAMELLTEHVYQPLLAEYEQQTAFMMGFHKALGSDSILQSSAFGQNTIFAPKLLPLIFQFARTHKADILVKPDEDVSRRLGVFN